MKRARAKLHFCREVGNVSGFTLIEAIFGFILLGIVVSAGNYALQPVAQASKRNRQTLRLHRLENEIRRSIFYINSAAPGAPLEIKLSESEIVLGTQGTVVYLSENLTESSTTLTSESAFQTRIDIAETAAGSGDWRLLYQIEALDKKLQIPSVGLSVWPSSVESYVQSNFTSDNSLIQIPPEIALARPQGCTSGIMRGIQKVNGEYKAICWNFLKDNTTPNWSIPSSYTLDDLTGTIIVNYTQLNKAECPPMTIQTNDGVNRSFPNFYAFSTVELRDFFPPRSPGSELSTQCERVINFNPDNLPGGVIAQVSSKCPDKKLYTKNDTSGTCTPNFDLNSVPAMRNAVVVSAP